MKIILATDSSRYSKWAADEVSRLPLSHPPKISVLHVVDVAKLTHPLIAPPVAMGQSKVMRQEIEKSFLAAERVLSRISAQLRSHGKRVRPILEKGGVAEKIIARAKSERADLVVVGSRGLSDIPAFLMGSVSIKVAHYAPCSVLIVKKRTRQVKRILVAVDGSSHTDTAIKFLKTHFRPAACRLTVLHVRDYPVIPENASFPALHQKYSRKLVQAGFKAKGLSLVGHPSLGILKTAQRQKIDLIVVGSRGLTGFKQFLLGSVSNKVMKYSRTSVLLVRGG